MSDPPIKEENFFAGVTVVDIGDIRVARGLSRRHHASCRHGHMVYDERERRIWCKECEHDVEPFDAFKALVEYFSGALKRLEVREREVAQAEQFQARSLAAKALDKAWRKRKMVPCCPHCKNGLFPEHFKNRPDMMSREYAEARLRSTRRQP